MADAPTVRQPSFSVNLPAELRRELHTIASRELSTIGHVIRRACVLEVERHRRSQRRSEQAAQVVSPRAADCV